MLLLLGCSVMSCVRLFAAQWTEAHQAPLSMGFSSQEYWGGELNPMYVCVPGLSLDTVWYFLDKRRNEGECH